MGNVRQACWNLVGSSLPAHEINPKPGRKATGESAAVSHLVSKAEAGKACLGAGEKLGNRGLGPP